MINSIFFSRLRIVPSCFMSALLFCSSTLAAPVTIPANTRVYVTLDQDVSGKKKRTNVGQVVRASVWRDVIVDQRVVIKEGSPVLVRVDKIKGAKVAGIKGKLSLGAYETDSVEGYPIQLGGGYFKEGKGRIALTSTLAGIVFLPLIFIKGKSANLPRGTVFDAYVDRSVTIEMEEVKNARRINMSSLMRNGLSAEILYDDLEGADEPKVFPLLIKAPAGNSGEFVIDFVNSAPIDSIKLEAVRDTTDGDMETWYAGAEIKILGKQFKKGINTFEISTFIDGERVSTEVVLDIQI